MKKDPIDSTLGGNLPVSLMRRHLHWWSGLLTVGLIGGGLWMPQEVTGLISTINAGNEWQIVLHKSVGMIVLFITLIRIAATLLGKGFIPSQHSKFETFIANAVQTYFLCVLVALPMTGMLMHKFTMNATALWLVPPTWLQNDTPNTQLVLLMSSVHTCLAWGMVVALMFHLAGTLKHHLIDGDNTLVRMLKQLERPNDQEQSATSFEANADTTTQSRIPPGATFGRIIGVFAAGVLAIGAGLVELIKAFDG